MHTEYLIFNFQNDETEKINMFRMSEMYYFANLTAFSLIPIDEGFFA